MRATLCVFVVLAGCGDGGTGTPDSGTSMDSGIGVDSGGSDSSATDSGATDSGGTVDAPSTFDAGGAPMCSETELGWCPAGVECLRCPTGSITEVHYCTRSCTSAADCTDPAYPDCSIDMFSGGMGVCVPAGMVCRWGVMCASPTTPIATPFGERPIAELQVGDLVYGEDRGAMRAVPIREVVRTPVLDHRVVRLELATGRVLEISPGHPTADGRFFADLRSGDTLDGIPIVSAELVPYVHAFTHDILPDSDTGTYVAGGALIGSTLGH